MQGLQLADYSPSESKKQVREAIAADPSTVYVEAISPFGSEYGGAASGLPEREQVHFVGPDPSTSRKFYGTIERSKSKLVLR